MGFYKLKLTSIDQNTLISCNKYGSSNTSTSLKILISCQDTWRPRTERRTMSVTMTSTVTPTLAADWDNTHFILNICIQVTISMDDIRMGK